MADVLPAAAPKARSGRGFLGLNAKTWWWALPLALLLGLAALALFAGWQTRRRLDAYWAGERGAGRATSWAEMLGPAHADDANASVPYATAGDLVNKWETPLYAADKSMAEISGKWRNPKWRSAVAQRFGQPGDLEKLLADADRRERWRSVTQINEDDPFSTLLPHIQNQRSIARVEPTLAFAEALAGDRDAGLRRLTRMLRLQRQSGACEPFLIAMLVGVAMDQISMGAANDIARLGPCGPAALAELEAELARREDNAAFARAMQSEKLAFQGGVRKQFAALPQVLQDHNIEKGLRLLDRALAEPWGAQGKALDAEIRALASDRFSKALHAPVLMFVPAIDACRTAHERRRAAARCLRIVLARQRLGDAPPLAGLGLPAEALLDPFDGQPLRERGAGKDRIVYSVGKNGRDEQGNQLDGNPNSGDLGWGPPAP